MQDERSKPQDDQVEAHREPDSEAPEKLATEDDNEVEAHHRGHHSPVEQQEN